MTRAQKIANHLLPALTTEHHANRAKAIVNKLLLEYGKIDAGEDEIGRTRWNVPREQPNYKCFWISPEGEIIGVSAHRDWAKRNVLQAEPDPIPVYLRMDELGYVRGTMEGRTFYCNTAKLNAKQEAAVDKFVSSKGLALQHAIIA